MYTCIADNGVGSSALKQIQFEVKGKMNAKRILLLSFVADFKNSSIRSLTNAKLLTNKKN